MLAGASWWFIVIPRHVRRYHILIVPSFIRFLWAAMFILAVYTNVVGWFAAQDLGDARWVQFPLIQLGFTLGFIADDLWWHWRDGVAHALQKTCLTGSALTPKAKSAKRPCGAGTKSRAGLGGSARTAIARRYGLSIRGGAWKRTSGR